MLLRCSVEEETELPWWRQQWWRQQALAGTTMRALSWRGNGFFEAKKTPNPKLDAILVSTKALKAPAS